METSDTLDRLARVAIEAIVLRQAEAAPGALERVLKAIDGLPVMPDNALAGGDAGAPAVGRAWTAAATSSCHDGAGLAATRI